MESSRASSLSNFFHVSKPVPPLRVWKSARAVFQAVKAQVEAGGGTMQSIVKINTYLTDIRHRADLVPVREEFFGKKTPASTLVAVAALAQPDWLIEVEAIAVV